MKAMSSSEPPVRRSAALAVILVALLAMSGLAAQADEHRTVPSRPGVTQPFDFIAAAAPKASVILFPGGNGDVASVRQNFLLRVRQQIASGGLNVAVADVPSDHSGGVAIQYRASAEAGADAAAIVGFFTAAVPLPVWVIGTSNGSVSAANVAARLGPDRIAGAVLTSSVWSGGMSFVPLNDIAVPTLIVHNRADTCPSSPFAGADLAVAQLSRAPAKELLAVSGGISKSRPCEALAPHGYYGIEDQVVPRMVEWIISHSATARTH